MFNVTVLKIKDVVKYLIELIIFILIVICLYKGVSGIKIENNQISKKIIKRKSQLEKVRRNKRNKRGV